MKQKLEVIKKKAVQAFGWCSAWYEKYPYAYYHSLVKRAKSDVKERNRILILSLSLLFVFDYFMICYHIEKNIFDIFPSIPLLNETKEATVFLPSLDGNTLLEEKRDIPLFDSDEQNVKYLLSLVVQGSKYDNTSFAVPVNLRVRKIWVFDPGMQKGKGQMQCVIDVDAGTVLDKSVVIKGTESLFKKALEKTVTANIPSIKNVILLEKGIPESSLWEL